MRKALANHPGEFVSEALEGLTLSHPELLQLNAQHKFVQRKQRAHNKVGLVSGGGSGHEPLHAGFVGHGMLDVAVAGAVFASPTALQVLEGTKAADNGHGVVQIVKNYTGDVINFRIAGEITDDDGIATEIVLVDDDLATQTDTDGPGRRGTAATVIVEKACGAAAEAGADLATVARIGRDIAARTRTMSLALHAGTYPGDTRPQFDLAPDEVEFGVGIHGERGRARIPLSTADDHVAQLLEPLLADLALSRGTGVIAIVNGLGSTYPMELHVAARAMHRTLAQHGISVARSLVGSYVTSLDMHGLSLTLTAATDELIPLWDATVTTPALRW